MYAYTYPASSQLLMTGQQPSSNSPCCESSPTGASGVMTPDPQQVAQSAAAAAAAVCSIPAAAAYDSRLLSSYPRLATGLHAAAVNGFYGAAAAAYPDQTSYVTAALGTNASAFYSSLPSPYDLKDGRGAWGTLPQAAAAACYPYDPMGAYGPYGDRYGAIDNAARRKNATRETTNTLKAWLYEHRKNPYPTKGEKIMLAIITKMTLTQVSTWFANARRRLKKENKMTWEPRNKTNDGADGDDKSDNSGDEDCSMPGKTPSGPGVKTEDDLSRDSGDFKMHPSRGHHLPSSSPENSSSSADCVNPLSTPLGPHSLHLQQQRLLLRGSMHHHNMGPQTPSGLHFAASRHSAFVQAGGLNPHSGGPVMGMGGPMRSSPTACHPGDRPKIWSLAHTATSDSPPPVRKSPLVSHSPNMGMNRPEYGDPKYVKSESTGLYCNDRGPIYPGGDIDIKPPLAHHDPHREAYSHLNGLSKNWLNGGVPQIPVKSYDPVPAPAATPGSPVVKSPRLTPGSNSCSSGGSSVSGSSTPTYVRSLQEDGNSNSGPRPYCDIGANAVAYDLHQESPRLQPSPLVGLTMSPPTSLAESGSCNYTQDPLRALSVVAKNALDQLQGTPEPDIAAEDFGNFTSGIQEPGYPINSCADTPSDV